MDNKFAPQTWGESKQVRAGKLADGIRQASHYNKRRLLAAGIDVALLGAESFSAMIIGRYNPSPCVSIKPMNYAQDQTTAWCSSAHESFGGRLGIALRSAVQAGTDEVEGIHTRYLPESITVRKQRKKVQAEQNANVSLPGLHIQTSSSIQNI